MFGVWVRVSMNFWRTVFRLLRCRFVGPPVVLLSLALALAAYFLVPVRYTSATSLVLTAPPTGGMSPVDRAKPVQLSNPLLQPNDGLRIVASILILRMSNEGERKRLGVGPDSPTELTVDDGRSNPDLLGITSTGPFVCIGIDGPSAAETRKLQVAVEKRIREQLVDYQKALGAPPSTFIAISQVSSIGPDAESGARWKIAAAVLMAGIGLGLAGAYGLSVRRAARRAAGEASGPQTDPVPEGQEEGASVE